MGFSLKKLVKKVGNAAGAVAKPVTKAARFVVTPVAIGVTAVGKVATAGLAATGAAPFKKLDKFVGQELQAEVKMMAIHVAGGAAVGSAMIGKPQLGAAAASVVGKAADLVAPPSRTTDAGLQYMPAVPAGNLPPNGVPFTPPGAVAPPSGLASPGDSFPAWVVRNFKALVAGKATP